MGNVDFVELNLLNSGGIIVFWNLSLIEENILDRVRISTALLPIGVSMLNVVKDGTGFGWTICCTLGWVDAVVWAVGRTERLPGVTVGA